jgi:hypothetical protein
MRIRKILIPVAVGAAGILTLAGTASAKPTKIGTETFSFTGDFNNDGGPVSATGVINDHGTDVVVSDSQDTFVFADGQITVFHAPRHQNQKFNQKQCTVTIHERGTYVFGDGTGAWAGYTGSGHYVVDGFAANACGPGEPTGTISINASGPINPPQQD